jgi:uncharacterized protein YfiM (DUF2279 family)
MDVANKNGSHTYLGVSNTTLDLKCETQSWTNPNFTWPPTGMYHTKDVTCQPINVSIIPKFTRLD